MEITDESSLKNQGESETHRPFLRSHSCEEVQLFDPILWRMRELVRAKQYKMTAHSHEEMEEDRLTIIDIEQIILTGKIVVRQRDSDTREWKYVVEGETLTGGTADVVAKTGELGRGRELVIITVYEI